MMDVRYFKRSAILSAGLASVIYYRKLNTSHQQTEPTTDPAWPSPELTYSRRHLLFTPNLCQVRLTVFNVHFTYMAAALTVYALLYKRVKYVEYPIVMLYIWSQAVDVTTTNNTITDIIYDRHDRCRIYYGVLYNRYIDVDIHDISMTDKYNSINGSRLVECKDVVGREYGLYFTDSILDKEREGESIQACGNKGLLECVMKGDVEGCKKYVKREGDE